MAWREVSLFPHDAHCQSRRPIASQTHSRSPWLALRSTRSARYEFRSGRRQGGCEHAWNAIPGDISGLICFDLSNVAMMSGQPPVLSWQNRQTAVASSCRRLSRLAPRSWTPSSEPEHRGWGSGGGAAPHPQACRTQAGAVGRRLTADRGAIGSLRATGRGMAFPLTVTHVCNIAPRAAVICRSVGSGAGGFIESKHIGSEHTRQTATVDHADMRGLATT
jgi:hypothetical protein